MNFNRIQSLAMYCCSFKLFIIIYRVHSYIDDVSESNKIIIQKLQHQIKDQDDTFEYKIEQITKTHAQAIVKLHYLLQAYFLREKELHIICFTIL